MLIDALLGCDGREFWLETNLPQMLHIASYACEIDVH